MPWAWFQSYSNGHILRPLLGFAPSQRQVSVELLPDPETRIDCVELGQHQGLKAYAVSQGAWKLKKDVAVAVVTSRPHGGDVKVSTGMRHRGLEGTNNTLRSWWHLTPGNR